MPTPSSSSTESPALAARADHLRALARHLTREDPDDHVQQAYVVALEQGGAVRAQGPWLRQVVRNEVRGAARRTGRRRELDQLVPAPPPPATPDELAEQHQLAEALQAALADIESPFREVLEQRFFEDLTNVEIAERLGCPAGTVRWRVHEGLSRMRRHLDQRYGGRAAWLGVAVVLAGGEQSALAASATAAAASSDRVGFAFRAGLTLASSICVCIALGFACAHSPDDSDADQTHATQTKRRALPGPAPRPERADDAVPPSRAVDPASASTTSGSRVDSPPRDASPDDETPAERKARLSACVQEAVGAFNAGGGGEDNVEHLERAAGCAEEGNMIGQGIRINQSIAQQFPDTPRAEEAQAAIGRLFERVLDPDAGDGTRIGQDCLAPLHDDPEAPVEEHLAAAECLAMGGHLGAALARRQWVDAQKSAATGDAESNQAEIEKLAEQVESYRKLRDKLITTP